MARHYLPFPAKRWIKSHIPRHAVPVACQVPVPSDSVEEALQVWEQPSLRQVLDSTIHLNPQAPRVDVIILTYNQLPYTRLCLESLYHYTRYPHFEVIIVDNVSKDGTQDYLQGLKCRLPNLRIIFNPRNEGFARGNNIGIMQSWGDYIVLLNNDTIVTPGWLTQLIGYLERDPRVGMVGPVTNSAGNEQMIKATYKNLDELKTFAEKRARDYKGRFFEIPMLAMFCVVFRRRLIDEIGLLDERFGLGTFEDDDFCYRARLRGYKLICAEDVFVHHFGRGSTKEWDDRTYLGLFERNQRLFERKWGVRWRPHRIRL